MDSLELKELDMSRGDPIFPFASLVKRAFAAAQRSPANMYQMFNATSQRSRSEPVIKAARNIPQYLNKRFGLYAEWNGDFPTAASIGSRDIYLSPEGTTAAFGLLMQEIAKNVRDENKLNGSNIKPVILMPIPTYGYFFDAAKENGIEVVTVARDLSRNGYLDPQKVVQALKDISAAGKRVVAYYDCSPHNPMGFIRTEEETRAIADILELQSEKYKQDEHKAKRKKFGKEETPYRMWMDKLGSRIQIIDDMVYDGLEYGDKKPFSYRQIARLEKHVFVLMGASKAGFVTARAGLMIGDSSHIQPLAQKYVIRGYFPNPLSVHAMGLYLSNDKTDAKSRTAHFKKMNAAHEFNGKFMKALVNGIDDAGAISHSALKRMLDIMVKYRPDYAQSESALARYNPFMRYTPVTAQEAHERLKRGMEGVRIITSPDAGFFHLLDFSALRGSRVRFAKDEKKVFESEIDIGDVFESQHVEFARGTYTGLSSKDLIMRVSYAMEPREIVEFICRMQMALCKLEPKVPYTLTRVPA